MVATKPVDFRRERKVWQRSFARPWARIDRTSAHTMRAISCGFGLPRWRTCSFAPCAASASSKRLAEATCGTIRLKLLNRCADPRLGHGASRSRWLRGSLCRRIRTGTRPNTRRGPMTPQDPNPSRQQHRIHCTSSKRCTHAAPLALAHFADRGQQALKTEACDPPPASSVKSVQPSCLTR